VNTSPAASAYAEGQGGREGSFAHRNFRFESGETLTELKTAYVTHGELNAEKDNIILLLPGTANTRHSSDGYIGPGKAFDTDKFFVIAVDAIGGGDSSKPADGLGNAFPVYTIRDMVTAQKELLAAEFGLDHVPLAAVVGASMGAFQALEWAIAFPNLVLRNVLMVPAARASNALKLATQQMVDVISLDPIWRKGAYTKPPLEGLRRAGRQYYAWTVTDSHIESLSAEALEAQLHASGERYCKWDAWSLLRRYQASSTHDVGQAFPGGIAEALGRVRARTLVLPTSSDRLLPPSGARVIADYVHDAQYREIPSKLGHFGWRPIEGSTEEKAFTRAIREFFSGA
jgi:homoserine O-acetyltransferase